MVNNKDFETKIIDEIMLTVTMAACPRSPKKKKKMDIVGHSMLVGVCVCLILVLLFIFCIGVSFVSFVAFLCGYDLVRIILNSEFDL